MLYPDRTFEDQTEVLSSYKADHPDYAAWGDKTLYSTLVKTDPSLESRVKKNAAPAFRSFSDVLGAFRTANNVGSEVSDADYGSKILTDMPELGVFVDQAAPAATPAEAKTSPITADEAFRAQNPRWIGPRPTASLESLSGYSDYAGILARNAEGQAGFGEQFARNWEGMIPFYGSVVGVTDVAQVALTARKLADNKRVSDEELLALNTYVAEQDRNAQADWVGKAGSVIAGSIGFAGEFAVTMGIGSLFAKAGTKASLKLGTSALQNMLKRLSARSLGATGFDDVANMVGKGAVKLVANITGKGADEAATAFATTTTGKFLQRGFSTATKAALGGGAQAAAVTGIQSAVTGATTGENTTARAAEAEIMARLTGEDFDKTAAVWNGVGAEWIERASEFVGGDVMSGLGAAARKTVLRPFADALTKGREGIAKAIKTKLSPEALEYLVNNSAKKYGVGYSLAKFAHKNKLSLSKALETLNSVGYDGIVEEMAEERVGGFLHGLFGTNGNEASLANAFDSMIPTSEEAKTELLAFAVPIAASMTVTNLQKNLFGVPGELETIVKAFQGEVQPVYEKDKDGNDVEVVDKKGNKSKRIVDFRRNVVITPEQAAVMKEVAAKAVKSEMDNKSSGGRIMDFIISLATLPMSWDFEKLQYGSLERALQESEVFDFINSARQIRNGLLANTERRMSQSEADEYLFGKPTGQFRPNGAPIYSKGLLDSIIDQAAGLITQTGDEAIDSELSELEKQGAFNKRNGRLYIDIGKETTPRTLSEGVSKLLNRYHIGKMVNTVTTSRDGSDAAKVPEPMLVEDTETADLIRAIHDPSNTDPLMDGLRLYIRIGAGRVHSAPWLVRNGPGILTYLKEMTVAQVTALRDAESGTVTEGVEFLDAAGDLWAAGEKNGDYITMYKFAKTTDNKDAPLKSRTSDPTVRIADLANAQKWTRATGVIRPVMQPTYRGTWKQLKGYLKGTIDGQVMLSDVAQYTGEGSGENAVYEMRMGATTSRAEGANQPPVMTINWNASSSGWHLLEDLFEARSRALHGRVDADPRVAAFKARVKELLRVGAAASGQSAKDAGKRGAAGAIVFKKEFEDIARAIDERFDELFFKLVGQTAAMYDQRYFGKYDTLPWAREISALRDIPNFEKVMLSEGAPIVARYLGEGWATRYRNPYAPATEVARMELAAKGNQAPVKSKAAKGASDAPTGDIEKPVAGTEKDAAARAKADRKRLDEEAKARKARIAANKAAGTGAKPPEPKAEAEAEKPAGEPAEDVAAKTRENQAKAEAEVKEIDFGESQSIEGTAGVPNAGIRSALKAAYLWRSADPDDRLVRMVKAFSAARVAKADVNQLALMAEEIGAEMAPGNAFRLPKEELVERMPYVLLAGKSRLVEQQLDARLGYRPELTDSEVEKLMAEDKDAASKEVAPSEDAAPSEEDDGVDESTEVPPGINESFKEGSLKADAQWSTWQSKVMLWVFRQFSGGGVSAKNLPLIAWNDKEIQKIINVGQEGADGYILNDGAFEKFMAMSPAESAKLPLGLAALRMSWLAAGNRTQARDMARQTLECMVLSPLSTLEVMLNQDNVITKVLVKEAKSASPYSTVARMKASLRHVFSGANYMPLTKASRDLTKSLRDIASKFGKTSVVSGGETVNGGFLTPGYRADTAADEVEAEEESTEASAKRRPMKAEYRDSDDFIDISASDRADLAAKAKRFLSLMVSPREGFQPVSEELIALSVLIARGSVSVGMLKALQSAAESIAAFGELRRELESTDAGRAEWARDFTRLLQGLNRIQIGAAYNLSLATQRTKGRILDSVKGGFEKLPKKATMSTLNALGLALSLNAVADGRKPASLVRAPGREFSHPFSKAMDMLGVVSHRIIGAFRFSAGRKNPMPFDADKFSGSDFRTIAEGLWKTYVATKASSRTAYFVPYLGDKTSTPRDIAIPHEITEPFRKAAKALDKKDKEGHAAIFNDAYAAMAEWFYSGWLTMDESDKLKFLVKRTSKLTTGGMRLNATYAGGLGKKTYVLVLSGADGKLKPFDGSAFATRGSESRWATSLSKDEMPWLVKIGYQSEAGELGAGKEQTHLKPLINRAGAVDRPGSVFAHVLDAVDALVARENEGKSDDKKIRIDVVTDRGAAKFVPKSSREFTVTLGGELVVAHLVETNTEEWVETTAVTHDTAPSPQPMMKPVLYDILSAISVKFTKAMSDYSSAAVDFFESRGVTFKDIKRDDSYDYMMEGQSEEAFSLPQFAFNPAKRISALISKAAKPRLLGVPCKLLMSGAEIKGKDKDGNDIIDWAFGKSDRWLRDMKYAGGQLQATWVRANIKGARYGYHVRLSDTYTRDSLEKDLFAAVGTDAIETGAARLRLSNHLFNYAGKAFDVTQVLDDLFNVDKTALRSDAIFAGEDVPDPSMGELFIPGEWVMLERVPGGRKAANPPGRLSAPVSWKEDGSPSDANVITLHPGPQSRNGADGDADSFMVYLFSRTGTDFASHRSAGEVAEWLASPVDEAAFMTNDQTANRAAWLARGFQAGRWNKLDAARRVKEAKKLQLKAQKAHLLALSNDILRGALESFDDVNPEEMFEAVKKEIWDALPALGSEGRTVKDIQKGGVFSTVKDFFRDVNRAIEVMAASVSGRGNVISLYSATQAIWRRLNAHDISEDGVIPVFNVSYTAKDGTIKTLSFSNPRRTDPAVGRVTCFLLGNLADIVIDNGNEPRIAALGLDEATFPLFAAMALYRGLRNTDDVKKLMEDWLAMRNDKTSALSLYAAAKQRHQLGVFAKPYNINPKGTRKLADDVLAAIKTRGFDEDSRESQYALGLAEELVRLSGQKVINGAPATRAALTIMEGKLFRDAADQSDLDKWLAFVDSRDSLYSLDKRMGEYQAAFRGVAAAFSAPQNAVQAIDTSERILNGDAPFVPKQHLDSDTLVAPAAKYYKSILSHAYAAVKTHVMHRRSPRFAVLLASKAHRVDSGGKTKRDWFEEAKHDLFLGFPKEQRSFEDADLYGKLRALDQTRSHELLDYQILEAWAPRLTKSLAKHQVLAMSGGFTRPDLTDLENRARINDLDLLRYIEARNRLLTDGSGYSADDYTFDGPDGRTELITPYSVQSSGLLSSVPLIVDAMLQMMPAMGALFQTREAMVDNVKAVEVTSVFANSNLTPEAWADIRSMFAKFRSALDSQGGALKVRMNWLRIENGKPIVAQTSDKKVPYMTFTYQEVLDALSYYSVLRHGASPTGSNYIAGMPVEHVKGLASDWIAYNEKQQELDLRLVRDSVRRLINRGDYENYEYFPRAWQTWTPGDGNDWGAFQGFQQIRGLIRGHTDGSILSAVAKRMGGAIVLDSAAGVNAVVEDVAPSAEATPTDGSEIKLTEGKKAVPKEEKKAAVKRQEVTVIGGFDAVAAPPAKPTPSGRVVAIIGTAGRKDDGKALNRAVWDNMVADARAKVLPGDTLISGGAAWADHVAVRLFLDGAVAGLRLRLPAPFDGTKFEGAYGNSGGAANYYHGLFSQKIGENTLAQVKEAIDKGAEVTYEPASSGYGAMNARNTKVAAEASSVIAYTFKAGAVPKDGGTLDTWKKSQAAEKTHVDLGGFVGLPSPAPVAATPPVVPAPVAATPTDAGMTEADQESLDAMAAEEQARIEAEEAWIRSQGGTPTPRPSAKPRKAKKRKGDVSASIESADPRNVARKFMELNFGLAPDARPVMVIPEAKLAETMTKLAESVESSSISFARLLEAAAKAPVDMQPKVNLMGNVAAFRLANSIVESDSADLDRVYTSRDDYNADVHGLAYHDGGISVFATGMRTPVTFARVLGHEWLHSQTITALKDESSAFRRDMDRLYVDAKDWVAVNAKDKADLYGFKDVYEFVAEAFANHEFQLLLGRIPTAKISPATAPRSAWQRFVSLVSESVKRLTGWAVEHSMLEEVLYTTTEYLDDRTAANAEFLEYMAARNGVAPADATTASIESVMEPFALKLRTHLEANGFKFHDPEHADLMSVFSEASKWLRAPDGKEFDLFTADAAKALAKLWYPTFERPGTDRPDPKRLALLEATILSAVEKRTSPTTMTAPESKVFGWLKNLWAFLKGVFQSKEFEAAVDAQLNKVDANPGFQEESRLVPKGLVPLDLQAVFDNDLHAGYLMRRLHDAKVPFALTGSGSYAAQGVKMYRKSQSAGHDYDLVIPTAFYDRAEFSMMTLPGVQVLYSFSGTSSKSLGSLPVLVTGIAVPVAGSKVENYKVTRPWDPKSDPSLKYRREYDVTSGGVVVGHYSFSKYYDGRVTEEFSGDPRLQPTAIDLIASDEQASLPKAGEFMLDPRDGGGPVPIPLQVYPVGMAAKLDALRWKDLHDYIRMDAVPVPGWNDGPETTASVEATPETTASVESAATPEAFTRFSKVIVGDDGKRRLVAKNELVEVTQEDGTTVVVRKHNYYKDGVLDTRTTVTTTIGKHDAFEFRGPNKEEYDVAAQDGENFHALVERVGNGEVDDKVRAAMAPLLELGERHLSEVSLEDGQLVGTADWISQDSEGVWHVADIKSSAKGLKEQRETGGRPFGAGRGTKDLRNELQLRALRAMVAKILPADAKIEMHVWRVHIDPVTKKFNASKKLDDVVETQRGEELFKEIFPALASPAKAAAPAANAPKTELSEAESRAAEVIALTGKAQVGAAMLWLEDFPSSKYAKMEQGAYNKLSLAISAIVRAAEAPSKPAVKPVPPAANPPAPAAKPGAKPGAKPKADPVAPNTAAIDKAKSEHAAISAMPAGLEKKTKAIAWLNAHTQKWMKANGMDRTQWDDLFKAFSAIATESNTAPLTQDEERLTADMAGASDTHSMHASFHSAVWNLRMGPSGSDLYIGAPQGSRQAHALLMKHWKDSVAWLNRQTVENRRIYTLLGMSGNIQELTSTKSLGTLTADEIDMVEQFAWAVSALYEYNDVTQDASGEWYSNPVTFKLLEKIVNSDDAATKAALIAKLRGVMAKAKVAWGRSVAGGNGKRSETVAAVIARWEASSAYRKLKDAGRTASDLDILTHVREYHAFAEAAPAEIRRVRGYLTHQKGEGFQDKISRDAERELRQRLHSMAVPNPSDTYLSAEMVDPKTQNELASYEHVMAASKLLDIDSDEMEEFMAGKHTKGNLNSQIRASLTRRWLAAEIDAHSPLAPVAAGSTDEDDDVPQTVGPKVLPTLKLLATLSHRGGLREWSPRHLVRRYTRSYYHQLADSVARRAAVLRDARTKGQAVPDEKDMPAVIAPKTMNFVRLRQMYVQDTVIAMRNQQIANDLIRTPGVDGMPEVVIIPKEFGTAGRDLITPEALEDSARMLSQVLNKPFVAGKDVLEQVRNLAALLPSDYVPMEHELQSVEKIFVRKGDTQAVMRHWLEAPLKYEINGVDMMDSLMHITQWSKSMAVSFSGFFLFSVFETVLSSPGWLAKALRHPIATRKRLVEIFRKKANSDPDLENMVMDMTLGGIMLGDEYAVDEHIGLLERDLEAIITKVELAWGPAYAKKARMLLRWGTGRYLAETFFGSPGKHGGVFQSLKIHATEVLANKIAQEWGAPSLESLGREARRKVFEQIAPFMNGSAGGQFWQGYLWATPRVRQFLNLIMFAPNWTLSAFNVAGGGALTGQLLGNAMSPMTTRLVTQNAAVMLPVVLFTIPVMIQAGVWAAAAAAGSTGPDDNPWMWNNEEGRKLHIDITPMARAMPWYNGDPTGKRRIYVRFGKQAYEVYDGWATEPVNQFLRKLSNPAKIVFEQVTGQSPGSDWTLEFKGKGMAGVFATTDYQGNLSIQKSRFGYIATKFLPMAALSTFSNMDAGLTGFFVPVSRGASQGRSATELSVILNTVADSKSWDKLKVTKDGPVNINELGARVLRAAEANGFDTKVIINSAKGAVLSRLYRDFLAALDKSDTRRMDEIASSILRVGGTLKGLTQSVDRRLSGSGNEASEEELAAMAEAFK